MEELLRVGVISSTHGVRGEVKVFPTTDEAEGFRLLKEVLLDTGREKLSLKIQNVKFFKNMVILKFEGYDNINQIEMYRGKELWIRRDQAVELKENEYFIADLVGLTVIDDEEKVLGTLTDVIQTGANDVYAVKLENGKEVLIPAIRQCILKVDLEAGMMKVHVLPGLMD